MEIKIDKLVKSKRKTIALQINSEGHFIVRAPFYATNEEIVRFIKKHINWVLKTKEKIKQRNSQFKKIEFSEGEEFPFLGNFYKLVTRDEIEEPLTFNNGFFLNRTFLTKAKEVFLNWYKKTAHQIIKERLDFYSKLTGLTYNSIKINSAKKRWGSCSSKNNLNFSWYLILTPPSCIDYVVVHELVHTLIKNHSKNFWKKVKEIYPHYEKDRKFLREKAVIYTKII